MIHFIISFIFLASFSIHCMERARQNHEGTPVYKSVTSSSGDTTISRALREAGYVPLEKLTREDNQSVSELDRDFFEACKKNNFPKAVDALKRGASTLINDENNMNPLFYAVKNQNSPLAMLIIDKAGKTAINPNLPLLIQAAMLRNTALFVMLRENGAQFRPTENIVTLALQSGNVSLARYAICEGAPVEDQAIFIALTNNYDDVVFLLLNPKFENEGPVQYTDRIAAPNKESKKTHVSLEAVEDSLGFTPLLRAARLNKKEIALRMLECGADCNARTSTGATALWFAAVHNNAELALAVLSYDASANISAQLPSELIELLNTRSPMGQTFNATEWWSPLLLAAKNGNAELLDALLQKSADFYMGLNNKQNALHLAVKAGSALCVQLLVTRDIRLNVMDKEGITPLQIARELGLADIEKILLDAGVEMITEKITTPVMRRMSVNTSSPRSPSALNPGSTTSSPRNPGRDSARTPGRDSARNEGRNDSPGGAPRTPSLQQSPREAPMLLRIPSEKLLGTNASLSPKTTLRRSAHGD